MTASLVLALEHLHFSDVIYRGLSSSTVLVTDDGQVWQHAFVWMGEGSCVDEAWAVKLNVRPCGHGLPLSNIMFEIWNSCGACVQRSGFVNACSTFFSPAALERALSVPRIFGAFAHIPASRRPCSCPHSAAHTLPPTGPAGGLSLCLSWARPRVYNVWQPRVHCTWWVFPSMPLDLSPCLCNQRAAFAHKAKQPILLEIGNGIPGRFLCYSTQVFPSEVLHCK